MREKYLSGNTCDISDQKEAGKPKNPSANGSRRKRFSYTGAVERFIRDAEMNVFPIKFRKNDCERVNGIARQINSYHENGQTAELQRYIARLAFMICDHEEINK